MAATDFGNKLGQGQHKTGKVVEVNTAQIYSTNLIPLLLEFKFHHFKKFDIPTYVDCF